MLNDIQRDVIKSLVENRNEYSYFSGSTVFNLDDPRMSGDLDIFHPTSENCEKAFKLDVASLRDAGYTVTILREYTTPFFAKVTVSRKGESTEVDWAFDTGYRFFPAQAHPQFGFALHEYDLLVGKIFACASRMAVRDYYDLCHAWERGLPVVGCLIAAPACDPGYSPEALLVDAMGFHSKYRPKMFQELKFEQNMRDEDLSELCIRCKKLFVEMCVLGQMRAFFGHKKRRPKPPFRY
jgi:hypothetical protein